MSEAKVPYRVAPWSKYGAAGGMIDGPTGLHGTALEGSYLVNTLNAAYAAGRASRDGLRKALESCQMSPWLSNLDPLQPLTASLRCESCDRTTQIITNALEADGEVGK